MQKYMESGFTFGISTFVVENAKRIKIGGEKEIGAILASIIGTYIRHEEKLEAAEYAEECKEDAIDELEDCLDYIVELSEIFERKIFPDIFYDHVKGLIDELESEEGSDEL